MMNTARTGRGILLFHLAFAFCLSVTGDLPAQQPPNDEIRIRFVFGSEKEAWLKYVTSEFEQAGIRTSRGKLIKVTLVATGSGKVVEEAVEAIQKPDDTSIPRPHLISPASQIYIRLADADMRVRVPNAVVDGIVGSTDSLVRSPVVIAMWEDMAQLLGWGQGPERAPGWKKVLDLINEREGWGKYDLPTYGKFKFGQTHPEYSNSGLIAIIAQVYAATGKDKGLIVEDVRQPKTREFLAGIARSVVHYGDSTGFFGTQMVKGGQNEMHAAVLYENMIIQSYHDDGKPLGDKRLVAIYPVEGTFWSDHPVGIVNDNRWVTGEYREAAEIYKRFLLQRPQQERAMKYGFRPGIDGISLDKYKFSKRFGVQAEEPKIYEEIPDLDVIKEIRLLWRSIKKRADIVLAIDVSNSMAQQNKLINARNSAGDIVDLLGSEDRLSILSFGDSVRWEASGLSMDKDRQKAKVTIQNLMLQGRTALYDAVFKAHRELSKDAGPDRICALIVLSDGMDTVSQIDLKKLEAAIPFDANRAVFIFTIGYGKDANADILKKIAEVGRGQFKESSPFNIKEVMEIIASNVSAGAFKPDQAIK